jgi:hypothetical protein
VPLDFIFYSTLPKLVVLLCFVALAIHAVRRRTLWSWCAAGLAGALALLAANPVNTPRQILLIGLLPLLVHALGRSRRWLLAGVIFGAIAGLGPVLNLISRGSMWGEELTTFPFSQDFDAMFVVAGILERAPIPDLGWGRYLLSAFSFFLPRDLKMFPDFDPLGWSAILGNFSQSNLSLPPFTTAYFDFGLAGPALLGFAISAGFRWVDRAIDPNRPLSGTYLSALVLLAAYVPFMRGPILGWGPFAASGLIAAVIAGALSSPRAAAPLRACRAAARPSECMRSHTMATYLYYDTVRLNKAAGGVLNVSEVLLRHMRLSRDDRVEAGQRAASAPVRAGAAAAVSRFVFDTLLYNFHRLRALLTGERVFSVFPNYFLPFALFGQHRDSIVIVHDLQYKAYPQYFSRASACSWTGACGARRAARPTWCSSAAAASGTSSATSAAASMRR